MTVPVQDTEALIERRGAAGVIVLNRPKALNALTLTMVRLIAAALDAWQNDPSVTRVVIGGAGEKAFCAGGDIRRLYDFGRAGEHDQQLTFWREEYQLNERIRAYPKPIVALIDGIVMGGGVGVSINALHRVAGERFSFAMPEVGIGFFPDVGATFLLPRLPHRVGVYLALTGNKVGAGDALALGLAQAMVPSAGMSELAAALADRQPIDSIVAQFALPAAASPLAAQGALIEDCFGFSTPAQIIAALGAAAAAGSRTGVTVSSTSKETSSSISSPSSPKPSSVSSL